MMTSGMYGLDPSNYPTRLGQPWKEEEVVQLLRSIQKKKSVEEIAKEHDRTVSGIKHYIRKLAVDYHIHEKRTMEEIQTYTGLTKEQIEDAITKHERKDAVKKSSETTEHIVRKQKKATDEKMPTMMEIMSLLKDIQAKLTMLIEKGA